MKTKSVLTCLFSLLILCAAGSAHADSPVQKSELLGKTFISASETCSVSIDKQENWTADCDLLKKAFGDTKLTGTGIQLVNAFGNPQYPAIQFLGKTKRPLQAFLSRDPSAPTQVALGLVYGSPADGMIEILLEK